MKNVLRTSQICYRFGFSVIFLVFVLSDDSPSVMPVPTTIPHITSITITSTHNATTNATNYTSPTLHIPSTTTSPVINSKVVTGTTASTTVNITTTMMLAQKSKTDFEKVWPGTAIFLQNVFIFIG